MPSKETKAFRVLFASGQEHTVSAQGASFRAHMTYDEAMKRLSEIDVLVIPGGGTDAVIKAKSQPLALIKQFAEVQKKSPNRERTLMSVCTGSMFLAEDGSLVGLECHDAPGLRHEAGDPVQHRGYERYGRPLRCR